ncbi:MAG: clostripain-related cysteine peptidase [bacterium]|nr:clostripain-related cysteine peptidase [bacterium]
MRRKNLSLLLLIFLLLPFATGQYGCECVDTKPPTVQITEPSNGGTVSGTVLVQALVYDNRGVTKVEFYVNNIKIGESYSSPYYCNWDTTSVDNGSYTITVRAYDLSGNMGIASITVTVQNQYDTIPPSVSITNPTDGQTVYGTVIIQATATDDIGVAKVEFYIDGNKVGEDPSSPYEYSWNTDSLQYNSQHTIQAKAYDNANNVGTSSIITVTIGDNLAPTVSITNPQNGVTVAGTVKIQVSVTERGRKKAPSGINRVEFYIDGSKIGEDSSSPYEYNWNTTQYSNGSHTITVKAYDNANNSATASITVNVLNQTGQAKWTFMVFMNGDNNLESFADSDLNEMKSVVSTNEVNIIVQLDRYSTPGAWRYRVLHKYLQEVWSTTSELDFGSPNTLKDFVVWTISNYPAERYALIIWDHGGGWRIKTLGLRGISYDDTSSTYMTMAQLKSALSQIGRKIDLLGMDACLMAMMEVAYQIKDYANYLVGSEESEPSWGWPYNTILTDLVSNPNMSPSTLASTIVNKYGTYYSYYSDVTQSAIDLSKISDLKNACDGLALALKNVINTYKTEIQLAVSSTLAYDYSDFRDLYHFAQNIYTGINDTTIRNLATNVMNKVTSAVVAEWHSSDLANSHGISVWLPPSAIYYNYYLSVYQALDFALSTQWDEFLGALYSTP